MAYPLKAGWSKPVAKPPSRVAAPSSESIVALADATGPLCPAPAVALPAMARREEAPLGGSAVLLTEEAPERPMPTAGTTERPPEREPLEVLTLTPGAVVATAPEEVPVVLTLTAGVLTFALTGGAVALTLTPGAVALTLTPGAVALTVTGGTVALTFTAGAVALTLTAGVVAFTLTPEGLALTLTPGAVT